MNESLLSGWSAAQFQMLEKAILLAPHRLQESGLFTDEGLAALLDKHPSTALTVATMGWDNDTFEWRDGDRNGVASEMLLDLVRKGRLWLNLRRVQDFHPECARLIGRLYDELEQKSPGFRARQRSANLLISCPGAIVHYHLDIPVNMLWHLRGSKRVWVYPSFDERFAPHEFIEKIAAAEQPEDIPYDPSYDQYALAFDVHPGQLLTWPQMTPHRVQNLEGFNVSLSTEHFNSISKKRVNVHLANRYLRQTFGWPCHSTEVHGVVPSLKQAAIRGVRMCEKLLRKQKVDKSSYPVSFVVDPDEPLGYRLLEKPAAANAPLQIDGTEAVGEALTGAGTH